MKPPAQMPELFNVVVYYPDLALGQGAEPAEIHEYVKRYVPASEAVATAFDYCRRPAAQLGFICKVQITDCDDMTNFLWEFGRGVVFPAKPGSEGEGE